MGQALLSNKTKSVFKSYSVRGLHYFQNFNFKIENNILIVVGESGWGKTTILYLLYLTLKRLWMVLAKQRFDFISIELTHGEVIHFSKSEVEYFIIVKYEQGRSLNTQQNEIIAKFEQIERVIAGIINGEILYFPVFRDLKDDLKAIGKNFEQLNYASGFFTEEIAETSMLANEILIPLQFSKLVNDQAVLANFESGVEFAKICNSYLHIVQVQVDKTKGVILYNTRTQEEVDLTQLSSGEKQIIYFFAKLFFSNAKNLYFLIDEPELSISIDWQRRLLIDVINHTKTQFIMAITHSPYIFDNDLDDYAIGINSAIKLNG